jgi:putative colanic acid biosynthesis UDP-glucose lipid carrier transferase
MRAPSIETCHAATIQADDATKAAKSTPKHHVYVTIRAVADPIDHDVVPVNAGEIRRWAISYRGISWLVAFIDILLIVLSATLSGLVYYYVAFGAAGDVARDLAVSVFVAIFFVSVTRLRKLYDPTALLVWNDQLQNVLLIWGCTFVFLGGLVFSLGVSRGASRGAILGFAVSGAVALLLNRLFWRAFLEGALAAGSLAGRKIVIIGWDFGAATAPFEASLRRCGFKIERQFTIRDLSPTDTDGGVARAISFIRGSDIEEVFLLSKPDEVAGISEVVERLRVLPIPVTLIANSAIAELVRHSWHQLGHSVAIELQRPPLSAYERVCKRAVDILAAGCGLLLLMPLLILVAVAIKIDSPGPILFRQTRHGFNGRRFRIFKFRSMSVLEDGETITQATMGDGRVTRIGALIRKTSIDEIPQLINVLRGEMSIVGPRPHAAAHDGRRLKSMPSAIT